MVVVIIIIIILIIIIIIIIIMIIIIIIIIITGCTQMSAFLRTAHNYSQKGVASLSCRRELRCDVVYPVRMESSRESHHNNNTNNHNNNNNNDDKNAINFNSLNHIVFNSFPSHYSWGAC